MSKLKLPVPQKPDWGDDLARCIIEQFNDLLEKDPVATQTLFAVPLSEDSTRPALLSTLNELAGSRLGTWSRITGHFEDGKLLKLQLTSEYLWEKYRICYLTWGRQAKPGWYFLAEAEELNGPYENPVEAQVASTFYWQAHGPKETPT